MITELYSDLDAQHVAVIETLRLDQIEDELTRKRTTR